MADEPTTPVTPAADAAPAGAAGAAPAADATAAPAAPAEKAPVSFTPEQQEAINAIIATRLEKQAAKAEKTLEERVAEIERAAAESVKTSEQTALNAIVEKAAAGAHNPAIVAKLVNLDGLTSANAAEIVQRVEQFLTENPYLVKASTTAAPNLTPAPGVGTAPSGARLLTAEELTALDAVDLANPDTMALYLKSREALAKTA